MKYYSLRELDKLFPGLIPKNNLGKRFFVEKYKDIFKPVLLGVGKGRRYRIPQEGIDNFKKFVSEGGEIGKKV